MTPSHQRTGAVAWACICGMAGKLNAAQKHTWL